MPRSFTKTIECCAECDMFDNNGGGGGGMCDHDGFKRDKDGRWVILDETMDPYEDIHPDCPRLKG